MSKVCPVCSDKFLPAYETQPFCSTKCRREDKQQQQKNAERNKPINRPSVKLKETKKPTLEEWLEEQKVINEKKALKAERRKEKRERMFGGDQVEMTITSIRWRVIVSYHSKDENKFKYACVKIRKRQMEEVWYYFCMHPGCNYCWNDKEYHNHHIVYRKEMPDHPELHNIRNIIRLCPKHHARYHAVKNRRDDLIIERWLVELFGPSILSFEYYAWSKSSAQTKDSLLSDVKERLIISLATSPPR